MSTLYHPNTFPNPVSHLCKIIATLIVTGFGFELIHFEMLVLRANLGCWEHLSFWRTVSLTALPLASNVLL